MFLFYFQTRRILSLDTPGALLVTVLPVPLATPMTPSGPGGPGRPTHLQSAFLTPSPFPHPRLPPAPASMFSESASLFLLFVLALGFHVEVTSHGTCLPLTPPHGTWCPLGPRPRVRPAGFSLVVAERASARGPRGPPHILAMSAGARLFRFILWVSSSEPPKWDCWVLGSSVYDFLRTPVL